MNTDVNTGEISGNMATSGTSQDLSNDFEPKEIIKMERKKEEIFNVMKVNQRIKETVKCMMEHVNMLKVVDGKIRDPVATYWQENKHNLKSDIEEYKNSNEMHQDVSNRYQKLIEDVKAKLKAEKEQCPESNEQEYRDGVRDRVTKYKNILLKLKDKQQKILLGTKKISCSSYLPDPEYVRNWNQFIQERRYKRRKLAMKYGLIRRRNVSNHKTEMETKAMYYNDCIRRVAVKKYVLYKYLGNLKKLQNIIRSYLIWQRNEEQNRPMKRIPSEDFCGCMAGVSQTKLFPYESDEEEEKEDVENMILPLIMPSPCCERTEETTFCPCPKKEMPKIETDDKLPAIEKGKVTQNYPPKVTETNVGAAYKKNAQGLERDAEKDGGDSDEDSEKEKSEVKIPTRPMKHQHIKKTRIVSPNKEPESQRKNSKLTKKKLRDQVVELSRKIQHRVVSKSFRNLINEVKEMMQNNAYTLDNARSKARKTKKQLSTQRKEKVAVKESARREKSRRELMTNLMLIKSKLHLTPYRLTEALGGKYMKYGWKFYTPHELAKLGREIPVVKGNWRCNGLENYQIIEPFDKKDKNDYKIIVNGLDLTPRPFEDGQFTYTSPGRIKLLKYVQRFYKKRFLEHCPPLTSEVQDRTANRKGTDLKLRPGEYLVPHLNNMVFVPYQDTLFPELNEELNLTCPLEEYSRTQDSSDEEEEDVKTFKVQIQETETFELLSLESQMVDPEVKSRVCEIGTITLRLSNYFIEETEGGDEYRNEDDPPKPPLEISTKDYADEESQIFPANYTIKQTQTTNITRKCKETNVYDSDITEQINRTEDSINQDAENRKREGEIAIRTELNDYIGPPIEENLWDISTDEEAEVEKPDIPPHLELLTSKEFTKSHSILLRLLDNVLHHEKALIFRFGIVNSPSSDQVVSAYMHKRLWTYRNNVLHLSELRVSAICWNPELPDILAVGYAKHELYENQKGVVCLWNSKNPSNYDQKYEFDSNVTTIDFSKSYPSLLLVGLKRGSLIVINVSQNINTTVITKPPDVFSDDLPIWDVKWVSDGRQEVPIACCENGRIFQFRKDMTFAHTLILQLSFSEGTLKGIPLSKPAKPSHFERPGITCMTKHPTLKNIYLAGTNDGCIHKCSFNFHHQNLDVFRAHHYGVWGIKFHPDCQHIFLTHGGDFSIRIWVFGTFDLLFDLIPRFEFIYSAVWSPVNPEIFVSISSKYIDIWDLRRMSNKMPVHTWVNPTGANNSEIAFSPIGHNIVVGDFSGSVHVYAIKCTSYRIYLKDVVLARALKHSLGEYEWAKLLRIGPPFSEYGRNLIETTVDEEVNGEEGDEAYENTPRSSCCEKPKFHPVFDT